MGSSRWHHWNFSSSLQKYQFMCKFTVSWRMEPGPAGLSNVTLSSPAGPDWWLQCLSVPQITRVDGKKLLLYKEQLGKILQRTLHLTCKQGYILSCNLLHHLLRSATLIYPTEYCSVPGGFDKPLSEYFPIKARIFIYLGLGDLTFFCWFVFGFVFF